MKKQLSLIAALTLAASAFTACGSSGGSGKGGEGGGESDKSAYKKVITDAFDAQIELDGEKLYTAMYPKEIVDLHEELGDFDIDEDEEEYAELLKQCTIKTKSVKEKEELTDTELSMTEYWLAEEKFRCECKLEDEDDWYDAYYDGKEDVEPFCSVTKGYFINAEIEITMPSELYDEYFGGYDYDDDDEDDDSDSKKGKKSSSKSDTKTKTNDSDMYVYYVKGEGWKVDIYSDLESYFNNNSPAYKLYDEMDDYIYDADLSYKDGYYIISSDPDLDYNVPSDLDPDEFRETVEEKVKTIGDSQYFAVGNSYSLRYVVTSDNGKDFENIAPWKGVLVFDEDWITVDDFEDDEEDYSYTDLYDLAVEAIEQYNDYQDSYSY